MKDYELTVIFHPDLEMNIDPAIDKVKKTITSCGGKITKEENDGKKRLAYKINNLDYGLYYYLDLELPASAPSKISSTFNISDEIIRFLLVKADPRRAKLAALREAAASETEVDSKSSSTEEKGE